MSNPRTSLSFHAFHRQDAGACLDIEPLAGFLVFIQFNSIHIIRLRR